jgi:hypothetical protein
MIQNKNLLTILAFGGLSRIIYAFYKGNQKNKTFQVIEEG